jgi:flagellar biosynthesis/type III secretory pathway protein FliH
MSSLDSVLPWWPADFDRALKSATAPGPETGAAESVPGTVARPTSSAPRVSAASSPATGWAPPALEEQRRPAPRRPARGERELGYEQGFTAGVEAGREAGDARVEPALRALDGLLQRLESTESEFARERERNLTALALVVARKLVQQEMEVHPEVLQSLVNRALEMVPAASASEVRMHPDDLEALVPGIEKLALEGRVPAVQWVGDPSLFRGSFMVDSPVRVIDGRVDSALRQLYERIHDD